MFPIGEELLDGRNSWQQVATLMATDQGPYFLLLATMTAQLEPFARSFGDGTQLPAWLKLVYELKAAELQAANEEAVQKKSLLAKATQKGKTLIGKLDEKTGLLPGGEQLKARMAAGKAYYDYRTELDDIALVSSSRKVAFQMAGKVYKEVAGGDAPFFKALNAVNRLKTSIKISGPEQIMFWKLVTGPLDFFWQYMSNETACRLQKLWEDEVLVEIEGISDQLNLKKILFVDPGYTASFVKGPAAPFIGRSLKKGYHARDVFGSSIPFEAAFFSFLNRGVRPSKAVKPNYYVTISGRPTSANAEARIQPHATRLELQCARKPQVMINRQYPVKKTFDWSPQNCGDVLFQIEVGNLTLTRKYTGKRAFAKFLKVFAKGHHTFYPADFPKESAALKRLKIKKITVRYNLSGHQKVIQPPGPALGSVPMTIVQCWEP
jgi:type VI secretion system protein ImpL